LRDRAPRRGASINGVHVGPALMQIVSNAEALAEAQQELPRTRGTGSSVELAPADRLPHDNFVKTVVQPEAATPKVALGGDRYAPK
jgi:hypothetical protein